MPRKLKAQQPEPVETVLILRTCDSNMRSYNNFMWPESGPVSAPDWSPIAECGYGLHGFLFGEGDGGLANWDVDAKWLVVRVAKASIIDLGGKVKFPSGEVVFCGDRLAATDYIRENGAAGRAIVGGTATAGDRGTATAGDRGTATAGYEGTAIAGVGGEIRVRYWDEKASRYRTRVGYVGEEGVASGVAYRLNAENEFEAVAK